MAFSSTTLDDGTIVLANNNSFAVSAASEVVVPATSYVLPAPTVDNGKGRLVHPTLGLYDYSTKPDEWVNIDADVIIKPVWASSRTLGGSSNTLWNGFISDVVAYEKWLPLGGMSMPLAMFRMLAAFYQNAVDPDTGYVQWFPNYTSPEGYKVLIVDLQVGNDGITLTDLVNAKTEEGDNNGWLVYPVTVTYKIIEKV